jgi:hypothetical protein
MDAVLTADGYGGGGKVCKPVDLNVLEAETDPPVLTLKM